MEEQRVAIQIAGTDPEALARLLADQAEFREELLAAVRAAMEKHPLTVWADCSVVSCVVQESDLFQRVAGPDAGVDADMDARYLGHEVAITLRLGPKKA